MEVTLVPRDYLLETWPKLRPHAVSAAEYTFGRYEPEDLLEAALDGRFDTWAAFEDIEVFGVVFTTFTIYPRKKYLDMTFIGGEDGMRWKEPMLSTLRSWARDNHCDGIESSGRPGWGKIFKDDGYKMLWQVYELPVAAEEVGA